MTQCVGVLVWFCVWILLIAITYEHYAWNVRRISGLSEAILGGQWRMCLGAANVLASFYLVSVIRHAANEAQSHYLNRVIDDCVKKDLAAGLQRAADTALERRRQREMLARRIRNRLI